MNREEILKRVAPCSLMCHTCAAYEYGVICNSSRQLLKYIEGIPSDPDTDCPPGCLILCNFIIHD